MNKEEILIEAYRLCEEIKEKGKWSKLQVDCVVNKIEIIVFEEVTILFRCFAYFDIKYEEIFPEDDRIDIQDFISVVKNLINNLNCN